MIFPINLDIGPQFLHEIQQGPDLFLGKPRKTHCNLAIFLFNQFFIKFLSDIRWIKMPHPFVRLYLSAADEMCVLKLFYRLGRCPLVYADELSQVCLTEARRFTDAGQKDKLAAFESIGLELHIHQGMDDAADGAQMAKQFIGQVNGSSLIVELSTKYRINERIRLVKMKKRTAEAPYRWERDRF